jgi:hypothetical protein
VAGASPNLNFVLGFERGFNQCLESAMSNPVTLCLIGGSVLAAKFKNAAALASIVATGRLFAQRCHAGSAERHQQLVRPLSNRDRVWPPFLHPDGGRRRVCARR